MRHSQAIPAIYGIRRELCAAIQIMDMAHPEEKAQDIKRQARVDVVAAIEKLGKAASIFNTAAKLGMHNVSKYVGPITDAPAFSGDIDGETRKVVVLLNAQASAISKFFQAEHARTHQVFTDDENNHVELPQEFKKKMSQAHSEVMQAVNRIEAFIKGEAMPAKGMRVPFVPGK